METEEVRTHMTPEHIDPECLNNTTYLSYGCDIETRSQFQP